jgi:hypothetical protein
LALIGNMEVFHEEEAETHQVCWFLNSLYNNQFKWDTVCGMGNRNLLELK